MPSGVAGPTSVLEAPSPTAAEPTLPAFGMTLRSEPSSVEVARRVTLAWIRCHCRLSDDQVDALLIVMSELCTNAVQHGRRDSFGVRGWMPAAGELRFEVDDRTPSAPPSPARPDSEAESGRGLFLVNALVEELCGTWGFDEDGSRAWCSLPLPGDDR